MFKERLKKASKRKAAFLLAGMTFVTFAFSNLEGRMEIKAGTDVTNDDSFIKFEQYEGSEAHPISMSDDTYSTIWTFDGGTMDGSGTTIADIKEGCKPGIYANDHTSKGENVIRLIQGVKESAVTPGDEATDSYSDYRSGSAMLNIPISLEASKKFSTKFTVSMPDAVVNSAQSGTGYEREYGGDGIAFVLTTADSIKGQSGGGMGYAGVDKSVIVELDSFFNGSYAWMTADTNGFVNWGFDNHVYSKGTADGPYYTMGSDLFGLVDGEIKLLDSQKSKVYGATTWDEVNGWGYQQLLLADKNAQKNRRFDHIGIMTNGNQKMHNAIYYINGIDPTHINALYKYDNLEKTETMDTSRTSGRFADAGVDDRLFTFWVDYDGTTMHVYYALGKYDEAKKPADPVISYDVDLADVLGSENDIRVGFTSAVGTSKANHTVHGFSFANYYESEYKVEHYKYNTTTNTYELVTADTETLQGRVGAEVSADSKTYADYRYNPAATRAGAAPKAKGTIEEDGSLVLKFYYDPIETSYKVEKYYQQSGGEYVIDNNETRNVSGVYVGDTVTVTDEDKKPGTDKTGYQNNDSAPGTVLSKKLVEDSAENVLKLYFDKVNTEYMTEYYLQNTNGTYTKDSETSWTEGTIGSSAAATEKSFTGYEKRTVNQGLNVSRESIDALAFDRADNVMKVYYNRNTTYKVEYYYQNAAGGFNTTPDSTSTDRNGIAGDTATVTEDDKTPTKSGYAFDAGNTSNVVTTEIKPDGTTVLKLYFVKEDTRYKTEYYLQKEDGSYSKAEETSWTSGKVGDSVTATDKTFADYTKVTVNTSTDKTVDSIDSLVKDENSNVMKLYYNRNTTYKVEYYYQNDVGGFNTTPDSTSADRNGIAGDTATVTEDDKTPTKSGYAFDAGNTSNVVTTEIKPDGTTVLKLYFVKEDTRYKTEYYLQKEDGSYSKAEETSWTSGKVGDSVTATDKTFADYTKVTVNTSTDKTVDSIDSLAKDENSNVMKLYYNRNKTYKVEYYYENEDGEFEKDSESGSRDGVSGDTVNVTPEDKTPQKDGYQYDTDNPDRVESETLTPDGDTILKVYFERKPTQYKTEYYLQNEDGTYSKFTDSGWEDGKVGNTADAVIRGYTGYTHTTTDDTRESITALDENRDANVMKVYYNRNTTYKVEYYYENEEGTFDKDSESTPRDGVSGDTVNVSEDDKIPQKDGYQYDADNPDTLITTELKPDGSSVLKVYFEKEPTQYKTIYHVQNEDGTYRVKEQTEWIDGKIGQSVEAVIKDYPGYTHLISSGPEKISSLDKDRDANVMHVYYNLNTTYKVEYYYENDNGTFDKDSESSPRETVSGYTVSITEEDKIPQKPGYGYDENNPGAVIEVKNAEPDGSTVLKVYFAKGITQYKTEYYIQNSQGKYELKESTEWTEGKVGDKVNAEIKSFEGYTHVTTDDTKENIDSLAESKDSNVMKVYYKLNATYIVEYYYENEDGSYSKVEESTPRPGDVGENVTVEDKDKTPTKDGYEFSSNNPNNIITIQLIPDKDTTLKLYFDRKSTEYKTEYWLQNSDGSYSKAEETDWSSAKVGSSVIASEKTFENYGIIDTPDTIRSIDSLKEDKSENIMKLYYNRKTVYKVEYWYQNGNKGWDLDSTSDLRESIIGGLVSIDELDKIPTKDGYIYDAKNVQQVIEEIANPDGTTTLRVYFVYKTPIEEPTTPEPTTPEPTTPAPTKPSTPIKTGDAVNMAILTLFVVSGATVAIVIAGKKKKEDETE